MFKCISTVLNLLDCVLYAVGKPVYHKATNFAYASWLKDSRPRNKEMEEKIWTTYETEPQLIYEFADKASFRNNEANELRLKLPGFQVFYSHRIKHLQWISDKIYTDNELISPLLRQFTNKQILCLPAEV